MQHFQIVGYLFNLCDSFKFSQLKMFEMWVETNETKTK